MKKDLKSLLLVAIGIIPGIYIKILYMYTYNIFLIDYFKFILYSSVFVVLGLIGSLYYPKSYKKTFILLGLPSSMMMFFTSLVEIYTSPTLVLLMILHSILITLFAFIGSIMGKYLSNSTEKDIFEKSTQRLTLDIIKVSTYIAIIINMLRWLFYTFIVIF